MIRPPLPIILLVALAACTPIPAAIDTPRPGLSSALPPPVAGSAERVLGQNQTGLLALFGKPNADLTEGRGHKLQFTSGICVLDAYLYAPKQGSEPIVTHIDTRQRSGAPIDEASCVAALKRRDGGK